MQNLVFQQRQKKVDQSIQLFSDYLTGPDRLDATCAYGLVLYWLFETEGIFCEGFLWRFFLMEKIYDSIAERVSNGKGLSSWIWNRSRRKWLSTLKCSREEKNTFLSAIILKWQQIIVVSVKSTPRMIRVGQTYAQYLISQLSRSNTWYYLHEGRGKTHGNKYINNAIYTGLTEIITDRWLNQRTNGRI